MKHLLPVKCSNCRNACAGYYCTGAPDLAPLCIECGEGVKLGRVKALRLEIGARLEMIKNQEFSK